MTWRLLAFRERFHGCLQRRRDALFELCDALLADGAAPSPVQLSLTPAHRRGWGRLYAALSRGRLDEKALRDLLACQRLAEAPGRARVYAVDRSSWPRCEAETSPEHGYYYTRATTPPANPSWPVGATSS